MRADDDLKALMVRYQQGDPAAAAALVQCLSPALHRFFLVQSTSRRYADDLLQETWLRLHQSRQTWRPGEPVRPWLYAIARHIRIDHFRRMSRVETREQQVEPLPESAPPTPPDRSLDLTALLATLPDSQREVVAMLKIAGMSLEEVARATSCSIGAVKQKSHRAYETLRERLTALGFGERDAR